MNKQKPTSAKAINWTRIFRLLKDGTIIRTDGYTWNPVGGCLHKCEWQMPDGNIATCYAKDIAERFTAAYPNGFEHLARVREAICADIGLA